MKTLSICFGFALLLISTDAMSAQEDDPKLVTVEAKDIKLDVPSNWKKREPTSEMRAAEFEIPAEKSGDESAELVVYHFGGPTGGTRANVQRWIDQFKTEGRKHEVVGGKSRDGRFVLVNLEGTYKKPDGPPQAQKTIDKPNSRVIGVVLIREVDGSSDFYFLKLAGPDALVASQAKALRKAIGVELESEKPMKVEELGEE